jgi:hypothetical protein
LEEGALVRNESRESLLSETLSTSSDSDEMADADSAQRTDSSGISTSPSNISDEAAFDASGRCVTEMECFEPIDETTLPPRYEVQGRVWSCLLQALASTFIHSFVVI